jgi:hypothetical protein
MDAENEQIDPSQPGVNIGEEMLDQVAEGFIDEDDEKDGRERIDERPYFPRPVGIIR